jgi:hypothetical protein
MKFDIWVFFENISRKFKFHDENRTRITSTLHEDQYTFFIVSRKVLLRMRNVSDKSCIKIKTYILYSITFISFSKIVPLWDNVEKFYRTGQAADGNIIRRMRIVSCITKAKNTQSEYVTLIAFHCKNGCTSAPQYYVIRTLPAVLLRQSYFEFYILASGNLK